MAKIVNFWVVGNLRFFHDSCEFKLFIWLAHWNAYNRKFERIACNDTLHSRSIVDRMKRVGFASMHAFSHVKFWNRTSWGVFAIYWIAFCDFICSSTLPFRSKVGIPVYSKVFQVWRVDLREWTHHLPHFNPGNGHVQRFCVGIPSSASRGRTITWKTLMIFWQFLN